MDDENSTLKSVGAIVLTLALFLGVGWYVWTSLFVPPGPQTEVVAAQTQAPNAASTTTEHPG